jgi:hypothetical protein
MTLPSNIRSLFAFGVFCTVGGAWLTLVTEVRTLPLHVDTSAASAAPERVSEPAVRDWTAIEQARIESAMESAVTLEK